MKGLVDIVSFSLFFFFHFFLEEIFMVNKDLKKFLAGLGVAGLITAGGLSARRACREQRLKRKQRQRR